MAGLNVEVSVSDNKGVQFSYLRLWIFSRIYSYKVNAIYISRRFLHICVCFVEQDIFGTIRRSRSRFSRVSMLSNRYILPIE